eukprot:scaffold601_cov496-Prasinococcus_capsulatus_cf.AAC.7
MLVEGHSGTGAGRPLPSERVWLDVQVGSQQRKRARKRERERGTRRSALPTRRPIRAGRAPCCSSCGASRPWRASGPTAP